MKAGKQPSPRKPTLLEEEPDANDGATVHFDGGVELLHSGDGGDVPFGTESESHGTMIWFGLVGSIIDALERGSVLLADELDAGLHPKLVRQLVRLFQDPETNPRRAQLIFNSHDVTLLGEGVPAALLSRDQIWLTEKQSDGNTSLTPLADLSPRKHEAIGKRYLAGRYGATPIVSDGEFDAVGRLISSAHTQ